MFSSAALAAGLLTTAKGPKAKGGRSHQQLLDKRHDWEEIKKPQR